MASGRLRLHCGGQHVLAGLAHMAQQVAQEVHTAPLPAAALEHALDRCSQAKVSVGDHQPGASQTALFCFAEACGYERAKELAPEAFGLAVANGDPQYLAIAEGIDADRHNHCP